MIRSYINLAVDKASRNKWTTEQPRDLYSRVFTSADHRLTDVASISDR